MVERIDMLAAAHFYQPCICITAAGCPQARMLLLACTEVCMCRACWSALTHILCLGSVCVDPTCTARLGVFTEDISAPDCLSLRVSLPFNLKRHTKLLAGQQCSPLL